MHDNRLRRIRTERSYSRGRHRRNYRNHENGSFESVAPEISFGLHGGNPSAIAITGAGDSWYLDYLFEELVRYFRDHETLTIAQLETEFRRIIREFYTEHVVPLLTLGA